MGKMFADPRGKSLEELFDLSSEEPDGKTLLIGKAKSLPRASKPTIKAARKPKVAAKPKPKKKYGKQPEPSFDDRPNSGFIRVAQLCPAVIPMNQATIWGKVREGTFPAPIKLGPKTTAWLVADIRTWLREQVEHRRRSTRRMGPATKKSAPATTKTA
jgi:predicted DNA-binding transcriptional regulator AlpA